MTRPGRLRLQIRQVYSDANDYAYLRSVKASGQVKDPLLARQLDVLINAYLENQMDPSLLKQIVDLSTQIEERFSTYRADLDGQKVTDNQIKDILRAETDSARRERAWLASKQVGQVVAADLVRLVKLRNQAARKLGFDNYHTLSLTIGEQDVNELDRIFGELYELTKGPLPGSRPRSTQAWPGDTASRPVRCGPGTTRTRSSRRRRRSMTWTWTSTTRAGTSSSLP